MQESEFVGVFEAAASEAMGDSAIVHRKANLLYRLPLNRRLEAAVSKTQTPTRGDYAFQTDICICEQREAVEFPRVVIEFKESITTHDILVYSAKAERHKQMYPCLRYGVLASEMTSIPHRFFLHNEHLDFFIAAGNYKKESELHPFAKRLIEKELKVSRVLEQIHYDDHKFDYYRTEVVFRNFADTQ